MDREQIERELNNMREVRAKAIADGSDTGWIDQTITNLEQQLGGNVVQEEVKAPITGGLPFDFSEYFGLPSLNGMIEALYSAKDAQYNDFINQLQNELRGTKEEVLSISYQSKELQEKLQQTTAAKVQAETERDDYEQRWNAACAGLSEKDNQIRKQQEEVERLNLHVDDLRKQLAAAPAPSLSRIDVTPNLDEFKRKLDEERANKPKVTNVRWEDEYRKTHYLAEDIDDTTIRIPYMELGKYDVLSAEQVLQFRNEREAQRNHADITLDAPELPKVDVPEITESQFRLGDSNHPEAPMVGLNGGTEASTSDTQDLHQAVTRSEFEALKKRVEAIENNGEKAAA